MHDRLVLILSTLVQIRLELGEEAFESACGATLLALGRTAMHVAEQGVIGKGVDTDDNVIPFRPSGNLTADAGSAPAKPEAPA